MSACNECCLLLSSEMDEKLIELVRKCEELHDMSNKKCGPGSSVGKATGYRLDGPGIESQWG